MLNSLSFLFFFSFLVFLYGKNNLKAQGGDESRVLVLFCHFKFLHLILCEVL